MRSKQLVASIQRLNDSLRLNSWSNYQEFVRLLLSSSSSKLCSDLLSLFNQGKWSELLELADSYSSTLYSTASEHRLANQVAAVIRKYPFPAGVMQHNPREKAVSTFRLCEHYCKRLNQRFRAYNSVRSPHEELLSYARQWIEYVIGSTPNISDVFDGCRYGPGASIGVNGTKTSMGRKMLASKLSVSTRARPLARAALKKDPHMFELFVKRTDSEFFSVDPELFDKQFEGRATVKDHNKITFVPKTAKTERTIAVEPLLNGYLQLGVETVLRKFLKRVGIDIEDQSKNQLLAREGSIGSDDPYVTIDLSNASDSISIELCRNILPPDWFYLLDQLRSCNYELEGVIKPFEKFVTMGNGFCFPLETLLFASCCQAVSKKHNRKSDFSVYGDDIICRQSLAAEVIAFLRVLGFKTNSKKTHIIGPFRESCGADWYEGDDVRPITLDHEFDSLPNIISFVNLVRSKERNYPLLLEAVDYLTALIPPALRFCRPYSGRVDGAFEVPIDVFMASPYSHWDKGFQCWTWKEVVSVPVFDVELSKVEGYSVALMWGALQGLVSRQGTSGDNSPSPFTERRKSRTKVRRESYCGTTSNWVPPADQVTGFAILALSAS